jgi:hypothetical protein
MDRRIARVLGEVIVVNGHGLYLDHDGKSYYAVHMDPDGRVLSRDKFEDPNEALKALSTLKQFLLLRTHDVRLRPM